MRSKYQTSQYTKLLTCVLKPCVVRRRVRLNFSFDRQLFVALQQGAYLARLAGKLSELVYSSSTGHRQARYEFYISPFYLTRSDPHCHWHVKDRPLLVVSKDNLTEELPFSTEDEQRDGAEKRDK